MIKNIIKSKIFSGAIGTGKTTNMINELQGVIRDNDIFGHDSYDVYCTKTGELRKICGIVCERCSMRS